MRLNPSRWLALSLLLGACQGGDVYTADDRPRPELLISDSEAGWYSDVYDACVATGGHFAGEAVRCEDIE